MEGAENAVERTSEAATSPNRRRSLVSWFVRHENEPFLPRPIAVDRTSLHGAALLLLVCQLALRGWMLGGSWFYTDDYRLLAQARANDLTIGYLTEPFDSQFMPIGRALAYAVAHASDVAVNWTWVVVLTLLLTAGASIACWWMLTTLFGARPGNLVLLGLYMTSALSAPATMWWAAGLNQLPLQLVWFASVAAWVAYLRTRRIGWLAVTVGILVLGLLCYVKTLVVFPILALLAIGWFATGSPRDRLAHVCRSYWPAVALGTLLVAGYVAFYASAVPQPFEGTSGRGLPGQLADSMIGTSFGSAAVGGPWHWDTRNPPTGYADPPGWAAHAAWVCLAGVAALAALLRRRTGRGWLVLVCSVLCAYALALTTRAPIAGSLIGLEMRYLTETLCALVLALGLVWLPLVDAAESSQPREVPLLRLRPGVAPAGLLITTFALGGIWSSATYAHIWHVNNPGQLYFERLMAETRDAGHLDVAADAVPANVMPGYLWPYNSLERLTPLYTDRISYPEITQALHVVSDSGDVLPARIEADVSSQTGPVPNCGWRVGPAGRQIPLRTATLDYDWWTRIGFLVSERTPVVVTIGETEHQTILNPGIGSLFIRSSGTFDSVELSGLSSGAKMCVDVITVGRAVEGVAE